MFIYLTYIGISYCLYRLPIQQHFRLPVLYKVKHPAFIFPQRSESNILTIHCFVESPLTKTKTGKYNHKTMRRTCAAKYTDLYIYRPVYHKPNPIPPSDFSISSVNRIKPTWSCIQDQFHMDLYFHARPL